jgi:Domain of unknown function (DUF4440)
MGRSGQTGAMSRDVVIAHAQKRAFALAAGHRDALKRLHHPDLRWTTHTGSRRTRATYLAGNLDEDLVWHAQELHEVEVVIVGSTAVLVAVVSDSVERDGRFETHTMPITQTWIRQDPGWVLLAAHAGPRA